MNDSVILPEATESTAITAPTTQASSNSTNKRRKKTPKTQTLSDFSIRKPDWAHLHFQHVAPGGKSKGNDQALDGVTAHLHLTAALSSFLGVHGAAIPIDIMNLEGQEVWIRVPADDRAAVVAAAGGWISGSGESWRVKGWSHWDVRASGRDAGQKLFED